MSVQQSCMEFSEDGRKVTLRPNPAYQPKTSGAGFRAMTIQLVMFDPTASSPGEARRLSSLCPLRALSAYVARTAPLRKCTQLLICHGVRAFGTALSKQRLSHWIVDAITMAYSAAGKPPPTGIKAHSTRGVASSRALLSGVSVGDMCAVASWSNHHTFVKYYSLDMGGTAFAHAVLSATAR